MAAKTKVQVEAELDDVKKSNASLRGFCDELLDDLNELNAENHDLYDENDHLHYILRETTFMIDDLFTAADNSWWVPKSIRNALEPLRERFIKVDPDHALFEKLNALADPDDTEPLEPVDRPDES